MKWVFLSPQIEERESMWAERELKKEELEDSRILHIYMCVCAEDRLGFSRRVDLPFLIVGSRLPTWH